MQREAILQQLDLRHIVLLSNLAYSAAGEVLNCNTFDVATHAAIELQVGILSAAVPPRKASSKQSSACTNIGLSMPCTLISQSTLEGLLITICVWQAVPL